MFLQFVSSLDPEIQLAFIQLPVCHSVTLWFIINTHLVFVAFRGMELLKTWNLLREELTKDALC